MQRVESEIAIGNAFIFFNNHRTQQKHMTNPLNLKSCNFCNTEAQGYQTSHSRCLLSKYNHYLFGAYDYSRQNVKQMDKMYRSNNYMYQQ